MKLILVIPFMDMGILVSVFNGGATVETKAQKDTYYRALTNQKMNWRNLLLLFVKRYLSLEQKFATPKDIHKCLIFDDTCLLYTSDAADDLLCVDLGGRRIIKKKKKKNK